MMHFPHVYFHLMHLEVENLFISFSRNWRALNLQHIAGEFPIDIIWFPAF